MANPAFEPGQRLYYKPADFLPLQVSAGGECIVVRLINGVDDEFEYLIELASEPGERIAKERELTPIAR